LGGAREKERGGRAGGAVDGVDAKEERRASGV